MNLLDIEIELKKLGYPAHLRRVKNYEFINVTVPKRDGKYLILSFFQCLISLGKGQVISDELDPHVNEFDNLADLVKFVKAKFPLE